MTDLESILEKPIWRLTPDDLDALPPQERQWAVNHLAFLKDTGTLALILANPKGTAYETVWEDGRWKLKPAPRLDPRESFDAMRELVREELDAAFARNAASGGTDER